MQSVSLCRPRHGHNEVRGGAGMIGAAVSR